MSGWIKLYRDLLKHWCAQEPEFMAVWIRLLLEANHEDKKSLVNGQLILVKRGQLVFGREAFSRRAGVTVGKLRRYINQLKNDSMIDQQNAGKYSIISIINYDRFQLGDQQNANSQPADDQQHTTPKEGEEGKEDKENKRAERPVPYQTIVNLYHEILPELPSVQKLTTKRKKFLKARWTGSENAQDLDWWRHFFKGVHACDFLMGRVPGKDFRANFEWLITEGNFIKVVEGQYDNREGQL